MNGAEHRVVESRNWAPGRSVGPFRFGAEVLPIVADLGLKPCRFEVSCGAFFSTQCPAPTRASSSPGGRISEICCRDSLRYDGLELLGRGRDPVRLILGRGDDVADHATLGLTLRLRDGRTAIGICGPANAAFALDV